MLINAQMKAVLAGIAIAIVIVILSCIYMIHVNKPPDESPKIDVISEAQAENPSTIKHLAKKQNEAITEEQASEVSNHIKVIAQRASEPSTTVSARADNVVDMAEGERIKNGANFAILTSPEEPDKVVDVSTIPAGTEIKLNQYNIKAYKKTMDTIEYEPQEKIVGYVHHWRIGNTGSYIGVGVDYDMDDEKTLAKISYMW